MYKLFSRNKFVAFILVALYLPLSVSATTITATPDSDTVGISASTIIVSLTPGDTGGGVPTSVLFSGIAYPKAIVYVMKDGIPKANTPALDNGNFVINLSEVYSPNALYTLYATDASGRKSLLINYPVVVKAGYVTQISGIRFAPTIATDKTEVKQGDYLTVTGAAAPDKSITLNIKGKESKNFSLTSTHGGTYVITIPLLDLPKGDYNVSVNYSDDTKISKVIQFAIGDVNILSTDLAVNIPGDCNADQIINIVDFSVAAFWYGKPNPPRCIDTNNDGIINLVDFSILAFYWTN